MLLQFFNMVQNLSVHSSKFYLFVQDKDLLFIGFGQVYLHVLWGYYIPSQSWLISLYLFTFNFLLTFIYRSYSGVFSIIEYRNAGEQFLCFSIFRQKRNFKLWLKQSMLGSDYISLCLSKDDFDNGGNWIPRFLILSHCFAIGFLCWLVNSFEASCTYNPFGQKTK